MTPTGTWWALRLGAETGGGGNWYSILCVSFTGTTKLMLQHANWRPALPTNEQHLARVLLSGPEEQLDTRQRHHGVNGPRIARVGGQLSVSQMPETEPQLLLSLPLWRCNATVVNWVSRRRWRGVPRVHFREGKRVLFFFQRLLRKPSIHHTDSDCDQLIKLTVFARILAFSPGFFFCFLVVELIIKSGPKIFF